MSATIEVPVTTVVTVVIDTAEPSTVEQMIVVARGAGLEPLEVWLPVGMFSDPYADHGMQGLAVIWIDRGRHPAIVLSREVEVRSWPLR